MKIIKKETIANTIKVLIVEPDAEPYVKNVVPNLQSYNDIVGGPIEGICPFGDPVSIVCNEIGKIQGLPANRALFWSNGQPYDVIAGTFFVIGAEEDTEDYTSLSDEMIQKYSKIFRDPTCRWTYVL